MHWHANDKGRRKNLANGSKRDNPAIAAVAVIGDSVQVDHAGDFKIVGQGDVGQLNGCGTRTSRRVLLIRHRKEQQVAQPKLGV